VSECLIVPNPFGKDFRVIRGEGIRLKIPFFPSHRFDFDPHTEHFSFQFSTKDLIPVLMDVDVTYHLDEPSIEHIFEVLGSQKEIDEAIFNLTRSSTKMLLGTNVKSSEIITEAQKQQVQPKLEEILLTQLSVLAAQYFITVEKVQITIA